MEAKLSQLGCPAPAPFRSSIIPISSTTQTQTPVADRPGEVLLACGEGSLLPSESIFREQDTNWLMGIDHLYSLQMNLWYLTVFYKFRLGL